MHSESEVTYTLECYRACTETIQHCLKMGGEHVEQKHLNLMMDCAKACLTAADFFMRDSEYRDKMGALCAEVCDACAKSCDALDGEEMKRCVKACRDCAAACRGMGE
ncbi:MAG: four-helix bundle copper-binding protein [bacterium]|nr:four-helix bundle copper-binding protein [bacterium]